MYAKTLIPGTRPIPALMATTNQADTLWPQLLARGWVPFGNSLRAATGELRIGVDRLQLMLDGHVVLDDDANPASPEGWWTAVDNLNGHCIVVVIRGDTPRPPHPPSRRPAGRAAPHRPCPVSRAADRHQAHHLSEHTF